MTVTHETRMEMIAAGGIAIFFLILWWMQRSANGGDGLPFFPSLGQDGTTASGQPVYVPSTTTLEAAQPDTGIPDLTLPAVAPLDPTLTSPDVAFVLGAPSFVVGGPSLGGAGGPMLTNATTVPQTVAQVAAPAACGCGCGASGAGTGATTYGSVSDMLSDASLWDNTVAQHNMDTYLAAQASGATWPSWM